MSEHNSNNRNVYDLDNIGLRPLRPIYPSRAKPSVTSPVPPPPANITERIIVFQSELTARNHELGTVRANYDQALVEVAHAANKVDEMRAKLSTLRHELVATQANLDPMTTLFYEYKQRYWPGRPRH